MRGIKIMDSILTTDITVKYSEYRPCIGGVEKAMKAVKNFAFGLWAKVWVTLDEMSAAEFVEDVFSFFSLCLFGLAAVVVITVLLLLL
jgi:hypothetical protein